VGVLTRLRGNGCVGVVGLAMGRAILLGDESRDKVAYIASLDDYVRVRQTSTCNGSRMICEQQLTILVITEHLHEVMIYLCVILELKAMLALFH
jgi:hypothetical protein